MNEKNHKPDDRLEGMLRQWGVDESARPGGVPPMPMMPPLRRWPTILLRWGPPAAAAAMLLIAVGLFVAGRSSDLAAPVAREQEDVHAIKTQLAHAQSDLQKARDALSQADSQRVREIEQLDAEIAALKKDFQKEKTISLAAADQRITESNRIIGEQKEELQKVTGELAKAGRELADARKRYDELVGKRDVTRIKLAASVSELDRVGKMYRRTLADSLKAQADLAVLKVRRQIVMGEFQRVYLAAAAAAGGMEQPERWASLHLRQSAARGVQLLGRCAEIRPSVQATSTGRLMDRLEVVLTRLNLLNPADPVEAKAFAALVRRGGLVKEIDVALAEGRQRADVRTWLLEARLILEGAENVA